MDAYYMVRSLGWVMRRVYLVDADYPADWAPLLAKLDEIP